MPQPKPITIRKLRDRLAEQDEVIRKLAVLADALLLANPSLAKAWGREETLARMLDIYDEEVAKANTVGGALLKAMESPANGGAGFTLGDEGLTLKSGAGTWAPSLSAEKAREEDEAREVRHAANRLHLEQDVEMLKLREARLKRERGSR